MQKGSATECLEAGQELAERRERWNEWGYWRGMGWTHLPPWVKRRRATLKLKGHPCQGCASTADRGQIECPLLGPKLGGLRAQALLMEIPWEYHDARASLVSIVSPSMPSGPLIPANTCRNVRRKSPTEAGAWFRKQVWERLILPKVKTKPRAVVSLPPGA